MYKKTTTVLNLIYVHIWSFFYILFKMTGYKLHIDFPQKTEKGPFIKNVIKFQLLNIHKLLIADVFYEQPKS